MAPRAATAASTRTARVLALLLLAVTALLLAGAGPASAHAALTGSDPRQGAVVEQAPEQVTLTFSEKVAVSADSVRVLDPKGNRVDTGEAPSVGGTTLKAELTPGLPEGTFTVAYQVVSEDSHPVSGAYTFSVGAPSKTSVALPEESAGGGAVGTLYGIARYVSYAGFTVLVGGAAFVLVCWRRGAGVRALQRLVVGGWLALTTGTLALLLLRGAYIGSGKMGDVLDMGLLAQVLQSRTGAALVCRLLLLAVAALFVAVLFGTYQRREDGEEKRDLSFGLAVGGVVVSAGLAATWALSEHASAGLQPGIAMPVDVVHLLAVALWLGGLAALLVALYRGAAEHTVDRAAVGRFSRVAFVSVAALAATGLYQSWRQVGSWDALTGTTYGRLLILKGGLIAVLVGVAWISRRWTRRLDDPAADHAPAGAEPAVGVAAGAAAPTAGAAPTDHAPAGAEPAVGAAAPRWPLRRAPRAGPRRAPPWRSPRTPAVPARRRTGAPVRLRARAAVRRRTRRAPVRLQVRAPTRRRPPAGPPRRATRPVGPPPGSRTAGRRPRTRAVPRNWHGSAPRSRPPAVAGNVTPTPRAPDCAARCSPRPSSPSSSWPSPPR
nr:copper resistance protein CopC [Streptomyces chilikensis]